VHQAGPGGGILCIAARFPPSTGPTAIRAGKLLERLSADREVVVVTETEGARAGERVRVEVVRGWRPNRLLSALRRLRMDKLIEWGVWPDDSIFWVLPAILAARRLIREVSPSAIVVFMMPYSSGLAGIVLRRLSGLPLILNLDDSPTCTDMHPHFPSRLHYWLATALENLYVRRADAVVYVSRTNLDMVAARRPEAERQKLRLVRYGAEPARAGSPAPQRDDFEIAYVGAMSGWWSLIEQTAPSDLLGRLYAAWTRLGRYERTRLDQRTSSPAIIGGAILDAVAEHPEWAGRVRLTIYGNPYPEWLVERALAAAGVDAVVDVHGPIPHEQIERVMAGADLLFLTLPKRLEDSPGGRISAKTYEYLATDRPILAAVSQGENRSYLAGRPGVWLLEPDDRDGMTRAIVELAAAKFAGAPRAFDRRQLHAELSYDSRAGEFAAAIGAGIERRRSGEPAPR
jgi:Glycosyl transferase 4-like domain/Glycosyl transferases group 1